MSYTKEWARDIRFRKKLKIVENSQRFKRFFLLFLKDELVGSRYKILKRKMIRFGVAVPTKRCLLTGRGRGLVGDFRIFRHQFKALVEQGFFTGITKSSW